MLAWMSSFSPSTGINLSCYELTMEGLGSHSFQLFGFDFMVDSQFHVWLLEVNGAPASSKSYKNAFLFNSTSCLGYGLEGVTHQRSLLPDLAEELVRAAVKDPLFPNHNNYEPGNSCHTVSQKCCSPSGAFFKMI
ncbi:unnamed protein product [Porites evermanni]|uniref:Tubulin--tyrosine ligase n=1 Tax=Porites evermanni TaxID=104178 RepID=A0ABN8Q140_9CNID|nr:unnamed protein product [Porites evermanni]